MKHELFMCGNCGGTFSFFGQWNEKIKTVTISCMHVIDAIGTGNLNLNYR